MESQPQNPEVRNNPKNFHPWIIVFLLRKENVSTEVYKTYIFLVV